VVLIPPQSVCTLCSGKLLLRRDRPSRLTLYTESMGTVPASHYHKYCQNVKKGCKFIQFYGFHKLGDHSPIYFDVNWKTLQYFISSQETGFELKMLEKFDVELLIGQLSYKQRADIYNVFCGSRPK